MTNQCENCQIRHKQIIQDKELTYKINNQRIGWFQKHQDYAVNYNNTVISLGYAALLFIFSSIKNEINSMAFIRCFGFFFLISVIFFVSSELHNNYIRNQIDNVMNKNDNPETVLETWFTEYNKFYGNKVYKWINRYLYFWTSVISGVIAGFMLIALFFISISHCAWGDDFFQKVIKKNPPSYVFKSY